MRNPNSNLKTDPDINTETCDCCGGEFYPENVLRVGNDGEKGERLNLCEECVEEAPEHIAQYLRESDQIPESHWAELEEHCKRERVLAFIPANEQINNEQDVREFFAALTKLLVWHPETPFLDYVDANGIALFREGGDHLKLDECMARTFEVCDKISKHKVDAYEIGFEELAKTSQAMADAMNRDHKTGKELNPDPELTREPTAVEVLKELELRMTQAILASNIGKKNQTDFLRGELERLKVIARAAIARAESEVSNA